MRRKIVVVAQSHHTLQDRARLMIALQDRAMERQIVFHVEQYETMLRTLRAASSSYADTSAAAVYADVDAAQARGLPQTLRHTSTTPGAKALSANLFSPFADQAWAIFEYMIDVAVDINVACAEHLMAMLALVSAPSPTTEACAHQLMARMDTLQLVPPVSLLSRYFQVCQANGCMHIAVTRFADARMRHEIIPTAGMCTTIITGFLRNNQVDEAVKFIGTLGGITIDQPLVHVCMDTMRRSRDPLAAFNMWRTNATQVQSGMKLDRVGLSILLSAWRLARVTAAAGDKPASSDASAVGPPMRLEPVRGGAVKRAEQLAYLYEELRRAKIKSPPKSVHHLLVATYAALVDLAHIVLDPIPSLGDDRQAIKLEQARRSAAHDVLASRGAFLSRVAEQLRSRMLRTPGPEHRQSLRFLAEWDVPMRRVGEALAKVRPRATSVQQPPLALAAGRSSFTGSGDGGSSQREGGDRHAASRVG
jgi:hypothetical protein